MAIMSRGPGINIESNVNRVSTTCGFVLPIAFAYKVSILWNSTLVAFTDLSELPGKLRAWAC